MTDKEVIINGVNVFKEIDEWADIVSQEWNSDEYSKAEIIKNYILDINKQLHRKEKELKNEKEAARNELEIYDQACLDLKNELDEAEHKLQRLQAENEELKKYIKEDLAPHAKMLQNLSNRYKQALEEIEVLVIDQIQWAFSASRHRAERIKNIINEVLKDE